MDKLTMHDRPFDGRLGQVCIRKEGSTLRLIAIPNPDYIPEELREEGSRLIRPTAKAEYRAMSNADYKQLLIDYGVTENPPDSFGLMAGGKTSDVNETTANASGLIGGAVIAATSQSDKQDSINNIKRYAKKIYNIPVTEFSMDKLEVAANASLKNPPPVDQKEAAKNFDIFVKRFVVIEEPPTKRQMKEYNDMVAWAGKSNATKPVLKYSEKIDKSLSAFKELKKYSLTTYGAQEIKDVNANKDIYSEKEKKIILDKITDKDKDKQKKEAQEAKLKTFKLIIGKTGTAGGSDSFMILPPKFPKMDFFPGGEEVDPIAVIHHEFGHTRVSSGKMYGGTLINERNLVVNIDNPARIINGKEPRYTYYDATTDQTINIIDSSVIGNGKMTFDPNDASKLTKRTPVQEKIWGVFQK